MKNTFRVLSIGTMFCGIMSWVAVAQAAQSSLDALEGVVSLQAEGQMEGVLVSAKGAGATVTVTVVSDRQGHYGFPAGRLQPGKYNVAIRADGYDLEGPARLKSPPIRARNWISSWSKPRTLKVNSRTQ